MKLKVRIACVLGLAAVLLVPATNVFAAGDQDQSGDEYEWLLQRVEGRFDDARAEDARTSDAKDRDRGDNQISQSRVTSRDSSDAYSVGERIDNSDWCPWWAWWCEDITAAGGGKGDEEAGDEEDDGEGPISPSGF